MLIRKPFSLLLNSWPLLLFSPLLCSLCPAADPAERGAAAAAPGSHQLLPVSEVDGRTAGGPPGGLSGPGRAPCPPGPPAPPGPPGLWSEAAEGADRLGLWGDGQAVDHRPDPQEESAELRQSLPPPEPLRLGAAARRLGENKNKEYTRRIDSSIKRAWRKERHSVMPKIILTMITLKNIIRSQSTYDYRGEPAAIVSLSLLFRKECFRLKVNVASPVRQQTCPESNNVLSVPTQSL